MPSSKDGQDIGTLLIEGVREALEHKRGERADAEITRAKVTVRKADVVLPPE